MKITNLAVLTVLALVLAGCGNKASSQITGGATVDVMEEKGCIDSDNGLDISLKGTVTLGDEEFTDQCISGLVIEYYCDGDKAVNQNMRCKNGCSEGRCI